MAAPRYTNVFQPYATSGHAIVIAVSGGSDSMALLDLYREASIENPHLPRPFVVTVDHGLRNGFASEAAVVETYCQFHQLPWSLARWEGEKPKTGIMAAARLARYRLLAKAAEACGTRTILTGHTLDDQLETLAMRAERGKASPIESDVLFERRACISRPLLSTPRAELRAHLAKNQIAFADDPSNFDLRFERARLRDIGVTATALPVMQQNPRDLVEQAAAFLKCNVRLQGDDIYILRPETRNTQAEIFGLRYLAATLGGFAYPASVSVGKRLAALLDKGPNGAAFTAQRCRFERVSDGVRVFGEARHQERQLLNGKIAPFDTFCAQSLVPLANAFAEILGTERFILPERAAI